MRRLPPSSLAARLCAAACCVAASVLALASGTFALEPINVDALRLQPTPGSSTSLLPAPTAPTPPELAAQRVAVPGWNGGGAPVARAIANGHGPSDFAFDQASWNAALDASEHPYLYRLEDFFLRNRESHGRSIGAGEPLRGSSWLNRPYEFSYQVGALIVPQAPAPSAQANNDFFASLHFGRDFSHYNGVEFRLGLSTPELDRPSTAAPRSSDTFTLADLSMLYYPWGDSRTRPLLRVGLGLTDLEFTDGTGARRQESLLTLPLGVGIKHLSGRSFAWRAEVINNITVGGNSVGSLNNLTLSFGLEHRFGGTPRGYWAWQPQGTVNR